MPPRQLFFRIQDILDALEAILAYTEGMEFPDFVADRRTVDAVIRNLAVIGEAAAHIPDEVCAEYTDIPWTDMRAMRNFVVHEYFGVSDTILWDTVTRNIPSLHEPLKRILKSK
ncbi:MAG: HepT-like ribonuclease domain-containing protein [Desulfomonilaceae bacterium]